MKQIKLYLTKWNLEKLQTVAKYSSKEFFMELEILDDSNKYFTDVILKYKDEQSFLLLLLTYLN